MTTPPYKIGNPYIDANFAALQAEIDTPVAPLPHFGYWSPLTNGNAASPDLIYNKSGDVIAVWTVT